MLTNQTIDPNQNGQPKPFILFRPFIKVWHMLAPPTQAHKDRQSATALWTARIGFAVFCCAIMGAAIYYAKPMRGIYKDWRADRMVKESRSMAENGELVKAIFKAQEAVKFAPENISAIRLNSEYLTAMRRPEALYFLDRLEAKGVTQIADRQTRVKALVNLNRNKEASSLLEEVLTAAPNDSASMKLAEEVWGSSQKNAVLLKTLKGYAEKHPDDLAHSLRLAKVQTGTDDVTERADGMRRLWELAAKDDALALQAIEYLDTLDIVAADEAQKLVQRLRLHPKATGWHQVSALNRQLRLNPSQKIAIVQEAIDMAKGKAREDLVPMVRWLVEQQQFLQVLALVPEEEAKGFQPLLENYLTALTMLGRFDDLERLVKDEKVDALLNRSVSAFYRAHLAFVLKKPVEDVRIALTAARTAADIEGRGDLCLKIAEYAEARGHADIAETAYKNAALKNRTERAGYQGLIRATQANGNTQGMLEATTEAVRRWPDDPSYSESFLYVNLLSGSQMELTLTEALKLHEQQPEDPLTRLLVALAYWRFKDYKATLPYIQQMDVSKLTAGQKAIFAAIARDSGTSNSSEAAREVINMIEPKARMLPEERASIAKATR